MNKIFSDAAKTLVMRKLFSVEDGRLKLFKRLQYTVYPARAMAKTFQSIAEKNGVDFLFNLGFEAGSDAADEMIEVMQLNTKYFALRLKGVQQMLEVIGFGFMIKPDPGVFPDIVFLFQIPFQGCERFRGGVPGAFPFSCTDKATEID